jgi:hypothetical protein
MRFTEAAAGHAGQANANAGRVERRALVEGDGVRVADDAGAVERLGGDLAGDVLGGQIDENEVVVRTAGHQRKALGSQLGGQDRCVVDDVLRVGFELGRQRLFGGNGDTGGGVVVRTTLEAREHRLVDGGSVRGLAKDDATARTAQRLVGRRGHNIGDAEGRRVHTTSDQARDVGDVGDQDRTNLVGDGAKGGEVELPRVGAGATPEELGPVLAREGAHFVEVDAVRIGAHSVALAVEVFARNADLPAVGQVAASGQRETEDRVAGLTKSEVDRQIGRAAAVGLHIDVLGAKQRLQPRDGELLDLVDDLLAFVVALAGVPF